MSEINSLSSFFSLKHPIFATCRDPVFAKCQVGFLARTRPHTSIMVFALSPEIGPVTGATVMYVCGSGFVMTTDQVSGARRRFSDGYNTAEAAAGDPRPLDRQQVYSRAPFEN